MNKPVTAAAEPTTKEKGQEADIEKYYGRDCPCPGVVQQYADLDHGQARQRY